MSIEVEYKKIRTGDVIDREPGSIFIPSMQPFIAEIASASSPNPLSERQNGISSEPTVLFSAKITQSYAVCLRQFEAIIFGEPSLHLYDERLLSVADHELVHHWFFELPTGVQQLITDLFWVGNKTDIENFYTMLRRTYTLERIPDHISDSRQYKLRRHEPFRRLEHVRNGRKQEFVDIAAVVSELLACAHGNPHNDDVPWMDRNARMRSESAHMAVEHNSEAQELIQSYGFYELNPQTVVRKLSGITSFWEIREHLLSLGILTK